MVVEELFVVEMEHYLVVFGCFKLCVDVSAFIMCKH